MEMLPQEILLDILSRLPPKSIGKSRCVSKPWKSLLYKPEFIKTHLKKTKKNRLESLIFIANENQSLYSASLNNAHQVFDELTIVATKLEFIDHYFSLTEIRCIATCDGLLLVLDEEKQLWLINPTLKQFKKLPDSFKSLDPRISFPVFGIGYDLMTDDYKVVTISWYQYDIDREPGPYDNYESFVQIYSVRDGTWKQVDSSPYHHSDCYGSAGVFVDRYLHWPAATRTKDLMFVLLAFDFVEEKFRELPTPAEVDTKSNLWFNHLELYGERLGIQYFFSKGVADFWRMEEYGVQKSWKKFSIIDPDEENIRPLCFLGEEQVLVEKHLWRTLDQKLVMYNKRDKTFKDIRVDGIQGKYNSERIFVESLVSPHFVVM